MQSIANFRFLKCLKFSWCTWVTTEMLVTLAYLLKGEEEHEEQQQQDEEPAIGEMLSDSFTSSQLEEFAVSDCFDVTEDYVAAIFQELHPRTTIL